MTISVRPPLESLAAWIRQTDQHASRRLELLAEAQQLLGREQAGSTERRRTLAAQLERWRYQLLNERRQDLTPEDEALCAALDLAGVELVGGRPRPPRSARQAIRGNRPDSDAVLAGLRCLDREVPLETVAQQATEQTQAYFGARLGPDSQASRWPMLLYAPIYLSNYCINHCTYCGFRHPNPIGRKHLTADEALREAQFLGQQGFGHLLLVAGEFPSLTNTAYLVPILRMLAEAGFQPSLEIAPQSTAAYGELQQAGACGITLYQETYNEELYATYHPRGSKASYLWRLEGLERAAEAGLPRLGLGVLLGLAPPHEDLLALMRHADYLQSRFPDCTLAFSLPRIHEAPSGFQTPWPVDDETFLRMYAALRVAFPRATLVLSTREAPALRDRLAKICITQMSAGSCTAPGGYRSTAPSEAGEQFPVCDHRSAAEVAAWLQHSGFRVDWSMA